MRIPIDPLKPDDDRPRRLLGNRRPSDFWTAEELETARKHGGYLPFEKPRVVEVTYIEDRAERKGSVLNSTATGERQSAADSRRR